MYNIIFKTDLSNLLKIGSIDFMTIKYVVQKHGIIIKFFLNISY